MIPVHLYWSDVFVIMYRPNYLALVFLNIMTFMTRLINVYETMYLSPVTLCLLLAYCFLKSLTHSSKLYISESNELVFLGSGSTSFWNSIFNSNEDRTHASARDNTANKSYAVPTPNLEHSFSTIQLREVRYLIIFSLMWFGCIE